MPKRVDGIARKTLRMIMEASRDTHPNEFGAILKAEEGVIRELMLIPGTISGRRHAIFQVHMMPVDFSVVGTVHSHPNGIYEPSDQDLEFFNSFGGIHVIVGAPYTEDSWAAWRSTGERVPLHIIP